MGAKHLSHIFFDFLKSITVGYNGIKLLVRCCSLCKILKKVLYHEENPQKQPLNGTLLINRAEYEMCFFFFSNGYTKALPVLDFPAFLQKQSPANSRSVPNLRIQSGKTLQRGSSTDGKCWWDEWARYLGWVSLSFLCDRVHATLQMEKTRHGKSRLPLSVLYRTGLDESDGTGQGGMEGGGLNC